MPALGMAQETGRLIAWMKQEGDAIQAGDILMEIETDKATVEVEAAASGSLANVTAQAGDDVPVGQVIALILAEGEKAPVAPAAPKKSTAPAVEAATESPAKAPKSATPVAMRVAEAHGVNMSEVPADGKRITRADVEAYVGGLQVSTGNGHGRLLASPKARRLAQEQGFDLTQIVGNGPHGAIIAADVLNFTPQPQAAMPQRVMESAQIAAPTSVMWRRMAERLTESWQTIPHFYLKRDVSAEGLINWRKNLMSRSDVKITFTDLLVKVTASALRQHPHANGMWVGDSVVFNEHINVGLAVAVDDGLIVPVIHDADILGVTAVALRRKEIVERAQNKKLQPADLQGGTFTISNLGMFGIDEFSAIVNPPQAAILAVGSVAERIVPVDGQAVVRPMMTLSLSCDHRAIDGARGAQFLATLAALIEDPLSILD
jgi:pyruvate dehydrogenase E2 component (dihydrolipoamide acetyltransferase)